MQVHITAPCSSGATVNTAIVMACTEGIVRSKDSNLLFNKSSVVVTLPWPRIGLRAFFAEWVWWREGPVQNLNWVLKLWGAKRTVFARHQRNCWDGWWTYNYLGPNWNPLCSSVITDHGKGRVEIAGINDKHQTLMYREVPGLLVADLLGSVYYQSQCKK